MCSNVWPRLTLPALHLWAIRRANDVEYGLCVWSENSGTTHRVAQAIEVSFSYQRVAISAYTFCTRRSENWKGDEDLEKFLKGAKENGFYGRNIIHAVHGWGKLQYLGKWKMIMKNGEMAMTNMIWEVLFGSP